MDCLPFLGARGENLNPVIDALTTLVTAAARQRLAFHPDEPSTAEAAAVSDANAGNWQLRAALDSVVASLAGRLYKATPFTHRRYLAHMNSDVHLGSVLGTIAGLFPNPNVIVRESSPGVLELETEVIADLAGMVGFDRARSWGYLTSGGTLANFDAIARARKLKEAVLEMDQPEEALFAWTPAEILDAYDRFRRRRGPEPGRPNVWDGTLDAGALGHRAVPGAVLASSTSHYSLEKALDLAGIGRHRLVLVPVDQRLRMDVRALRAILRQLARQRVPVLAVIANLGTTEEGAIDPVHDVLDVCEQAHRDGGPACHVHVDAALGGYLRTLLPDHAPLLAPDVVRALEAIGRADSVTIDPHKWGFAVYGAGAILYRDPRMAGLTAFDAPYLWNDQAPEYVGPYTVEGSRPGARVLSVWAAQRLAPLTPAGHGRFVAAGVRNAQALASLIEDGGPVEANGRRVHLRVLTEPDSCIVTWLCVPEDARDLAACNALNRMVALRYRYDGDQRFADVEYVVSSTDLDAGRYGAALVPIMERLGIDARAYPHEVAALHVLRCTLLHPWDVRSTLEDFVASVRRTVTDLIGQLPAAEVIERIAA